MFWRENESRFLAIASLVRNFLVILATGARVERLFNTARDIYYYLRGSLKSHTIEELILYRCILRFDLDIEEAEEFK